MRFAYYRSGGSLGLAVAEGTGPLRGYVINDAGERGPIHKLLMRGGDHLIDVGRTFRHAPELDMSKVEFLPPLPLPGKIICVGLNYSDHSRESGYELPSYPTIFARFPSSLVGHEASIIRPCVSEQLDFEGEFVAVIGQGGRDIPKAHALQHVVGYSIFNDASLRDFQFKAPQWTMGKNFDATGAFGPVIVSADELPPGAAGLRLQTRLNGETVQGASSDDLVFDVATLVSLMSEAFTLEPGDIIVTGTPAGVGGARKPPLWMKPGDVCEVEFEGVGVLRNPIIDQSAVPGRVDA